VAAHLPPMASFVRAALPWQEIRRQPSEEIEE
jgi:hypothetical protein